MASTEAEQLADGWDEERCIAALAQLERLQAQLDDLRLTIPRVVEPFNSGLTSGPVIFKQFRQATVGSQNDIKAFRAQWQGQDIQSIFEYTRESLGKNSDLSTSAQVPIYGWVETEIIDKEAARRRRPGARKDESHISLEKNEIARTLEEFRKTHPNITVAAKEGNQDVLIKLATGDLKLKVRVVIEQETNGRHKLDAECLGTTKLLLSITRCISSRPRSNDLKYLLDMIAAYKTTKGSTCAKCSKMLDGSAMIPTARRSKQIVNVDGNPEIIWEAFHEGCLE